MESPCSQIALDAYGAILPEHWSGVVRGLLNWLGAPAAHIWIHDEERRSAAGFAAVGFDHGEHSTRAMNERFLDASPCRRALASSDVGRISPAHHRPDTMYEEFLVPRGIGHVLSARLLRHDGRSWIFAAARPAPDAPFDARDERKLRAVLPHLRQALTFRARLDEADRSLAATRGALDRVSHGLLTVDASRRVVTANRAAFDQVSESDGLSLRSDGRFGASHVRSDRLLDEAVSNASHPQLPRGASLVIERPSGRRPYLIDVAPADTKRRDSLVVLSVVDPTREARSGFDTFVSTYGLSRAEARVAEALLSGPSAREIAEQLRIGEPTVRTHLARLYERTGTRGQAEFVALVFRSTS